MSDNTVTLTGNVTKDPELRFTPSGAAVANFSIAVNRRWKSKQGDDWNEQTSFFDIAAWSTLAENVASSIQRGTRVTVVGRLEQRTWDTDDGGKRSRVEIVADEVSPSLRWATAAVTKNERDDNHNQPTSKSAPSYTSNDEPF